MEKEKGKEPAILSTKKRIGRTISQRRHALGLDISDLTSFSGVSSSLISNIENGKSNATINTLEKILDILGLEISLKIKEPGI